MRVALAGNPNCGKTTLFNALTGSNQYVGNWPGVTVEKKGGKLKADKDVEVIDLPGIYSLSPYTLEEVVARNYIIDERPEVILNIVDGSNLERNLYLTTQLLELGCPVVVAVNMMDVVRKRGDVINMSALSSALGCPVVEISALKNEGLDELVAAVKTAEGAKPAVGITFGAKLEQALVTACERVAASAGVHVPAELRRFYAIKLMEKDDKIADKITEAVGTVPDVSDLVSKIEKEFDDDTESVIIDDRYSWISSVIDSVLTKSASEGDLTISDKIDRVVTNRILALPIFAVIMFLVYYISVTSIGAIATDWANDGVFGDGWFLDPVAMVSSEGTAQAAFDEVNDEFEGALGVVEAGVGGTVEEYDDETGEGEVVEVDKEAYDEAIDVLTEAAGDDEDALAAVKTLTKQTEADEDNEARAEALETVSELGPDPREFGIWIPGIPALLADFFDAIGIEDGDWVRALVLDGIVAGLGAMLGFLPQMAILFFFLSFLELCGYMSRVAFILDRVFRRFGLSGKSFIPLLIGSGCGVPGVMASRTIENINDRRMTVMTTTFIPCGAKLPFIALIAGAIFHGEWWVAPSAYFMGIAAVLISGVILKKTRFFEGEATPFVMELPAYHMPSFGSWMRSTGERCAAFAKKAVTVLLLATILIWLLSNHGFVDGAFGMVEDSADSLLAALGGALAWLFAPLGWGNWQAVAAAITGLAAKEEIVGVLGVVYAGDMGWFNAVGAAFGPAAGYSFLAFNLLCIPCFAAMAAIWREMGSVKWAAAAWGYECLVAYVVALWAFQLGGLATGEAVFGVGTVAAIVTLVAVLFLLFRPARKKAVEENPEA